MIRLFALLRSAEVGSQHGSLLAALASVLSVNLLTISFRAADAHDGRSKETEGKVAS